jgi:hypothetical protein
MECRRDVMRGCGNGDGLPAPSIRRQVTLRDTGVVAVVKRTAREPAKV